MQTATANPLAALLDAHVAAHHAGVDDADVSLLMEIGGDIADFAIQLREKFSRLTTGAMGTNQTAKDSLRKHAYEFDEPGMFTNMLVSVFDEDSFGYSLDAKPVIAAAVALRLSTAPAAAQALAA